MGFRTAKSGYSLRNKNAGVNPLGKIVTPVLVALGLGNSGFDTGQPKKVKRKFVKEYEKLHEYPYYRPKGSDKPKAELVTIQRYTELPQGRNWYGEGSGAPVRRLRQREQLAVKRAKQHRPHP